LLKGAIVGGALGYGAMALHMSGGFHWLTYGVIGLVVGLLVGRPLWSHLRDRSSTVFTPILKGLVGYGFAVGIYALVAKAWGGFDLQIAEETRNIFDWQPIFGGVVGALYGAFVEVDDAEPKKADRADKK
jgi:hypothetical protein